MSLTGSIVILSQSDMKFNCLLYRLRLSGHRTNVTGYGSLLILLPTPAARDYKGAATTENLEARGRNNQTNCLTDYFAQDGQTSQLNPLFVCEMMGFPTDYLISPFLSGEQEP